QAEVITKYMRKGRPLMVEGRLKLDQWESNDGQKRSKLGVILENFQFVGGRDDNDSSTGSSGSTESAYSDGYEQSSPPKRDAGKDFSDSSDTLDEDVPF
ncbi:MAG TPA: single-stranded DNA-binding protein, partial [Opitutae bacterium]|nr:single-stranded DNA-binding protein [Opitutae bacterium]